MKVRGNYVISAGVVIDINLPPTVSIGDHAFGFGNLFFFLLFCQVGYEGTFFFRSGTGVDILLKGYPSYRSNCGKAGCTATG